MQRRGYIIFRLNKQQFQLHKVYNLRLSKHNNQLLQVNKLIFELVKQKPSSYVIIKKKYI